MNLSTIGSLLQGGANSLIRILGQTGPQGNVPSGIYGEILESRLLPDYHALIKSGKVYFVSGTGLNPSSFTGGAAGTPLLGMYNPAGSNVDIVPLMLTASVRTTGTAAVATDFNFWMANQGGLAVTGAQTQARNAYSLAPTGSASYAMVNTANTAAVASTLAKGSFSVGLTSTTAVTNVVLLQDELKSLLLTSPGNYMAWGATVGTTAALIDFSFIWAEPSI